MNQAKALHGPVHSNPALFPRRILLAVSGLTPQVVTETLYALAADEHAPFVPTEVHLITSAEGARRAELSLLSDDLGWFHRLCADYHLPGVQFDSRHIHVLRDAQGRPMADIRSPADNQAAADWPHALGLCADGRPAVWRVVADRQLNAERKAVFIGFNNWKAVMERLAALKIGFRTLFKFQDGAPHARVEDRHILAYPVTNHGLTGMPNARLAGQMRFKVSKGKDGQYFGLVVHLPCAMPKASLAWKRHCCRWRPVRTGATSHSI